MSFPGLSATVYLGIEEWPLRTLLKVPCLKVYLGDGWETGLHGRNAEEG